jgi:hypothetical protein
MVKKNQKIEVKGTEITVSRNDQQDFISFTDIARHKEQSRTDDLIRNWLRKRNTTESLGIGNSQTILGLNPSNLTGLKYAGWSSKMIKRRE